MCKSFCFNNFNCVTFANNFFFFFHFKYADIFLLNKPYEFLIDFFYLLIKCWYTFCPTKLYFFGSS